jgi:hypothetical protein
MIDQIADGLYPQGHINGPPRKQPLQKLLLVQLLYHLGQILASAGRCSESIWGDEGRGSGQSDENAIHRS